MPITLHANCEKKLVAFLSEAIEGLCVECGSHLSLDPLFDKLYGIDNILPKDSSSKKGALKDVTEAPLSTYISHTPVFDFVESVISSTLDERLEYDSQGRTFALTDVPGFENPNETAKKIIEKLKTLPWAYRFQFDLPIELGNRIDSYLEDVSLSDDFRFVVRNKEKDLRNQLAAEVGAHHDVFTNSSHVRIEFDVVGFINKSGKTITLTKAFSRLKSFFGLAIAVGLLKVTRKPPHLQREKCIIHCSTIDGETTQSFRHLALDERFNRSISDIRVNPELLKIEDDKQRKWWAQNKILYLMAAFENKHKSERIFRAAHWLLDGYTGEDELLCFVQAVVVLEIMLGDETPSDEISLGALLRNRCAYLISKNVDERDHILSTFSEIYKVRSSIVHRGKQELSSRESALFLVLQNICERVIKEEVGLLDPSIF